MFVCMFMCVYIYVGVYVCVCLCVCLCMCLYVYIHIYSCVYMCVCVIYRCACMCVFLCVYVYIYIYTCTCLSRHVHLKVETIPRQLPSSFFCDMTLQSDGRHGSNKLWNFYNSARAHIPDLYLHSCSFTTLKSHTTTRGFLQSQIQYARAIHRWQASNDFMCLKWRKEITPFPRDCALAKQNLFVS